MCCDAMRCAVINCDSNRNSAEASWSVGAATAAIIERAATPQQNIDLTPCDTRGKDDCWNATRYE